MIITHGPMNWNDTPVYSVPHNKAFMGRVTVKIISNMYSTMYLFFNVIYDKDKGKAYLASPGLVKISKKLSKEINKVVKPIFDNIERNRHYDILTMDQHISICKAWSEMIDSY